MSRSLSIAMLAREINRQKVTRYLHPLLNLSTLANRRSPRHSSANVGESYEDRFRNQTWSESPDTAARPYQISENISRREKSLILFRTLLEANDIKETVYGCLDAWVAWEKEFPIGSLKNVLRSLAKQQEWDRFIQVIKWMLSKGQGNTPGTYAQLIYALDMDHRAKEAHEIWRRKVAYDLRFISWRLCNLMISVYYRNNMLEEIVQLFKRLEAAGREPTEMSVVQKVANTYQMLGLLDDKERVMEKYNDLFSESPRRNKFLTRYHSYFMQYRDQIPVSKRGFKLVNRNRVKKFKGLRSGKKSKSHKR